MAGIRFIWAVVALAILAVGLIGYDGGAGSDADLAVALLMAPLAYPIGVYALFGLTQMGVFDALGLGPASYASIIAIWTALSFFSYVQWFVLIPWLWARLKGWGFLRSQRRS